MNETNIAKRSPACHPRAEKISQCDVFEANFQKRVIGGTFLKARACERDLVAVEVIGFSIPIYK